MKTKKTKVQVIPKDQRKFTNVSPASLEDRNTKVKITMYVDLDVLDYFKSRATETKAPYQSIINSELRQVMEADRMDTPESVAAKLKQARNIMDQVIRTTQAAR
jgi:uncharacterized protein (DUF4415 family)